MLNFSMASWYRLCCLLLILSVLLNEENFDLSSIIASFSIICTKRITE